MTLEPGGLTVSKLKRAFLDIPRIDAADGVVRLPGSKSISNRVLLLAGLSRGVTQVEGLLDADDTRVMIDALRTLGCEIVLENGTATITGLDGQPKVLEADLHLGNAGTAMRPLAAALAVCSHVHGGTYRLRGVPRMHERPIGDLTQALRGWGCHVDELGTLGFPPLQLGRPDGGALGAMAIRDAVQVRGDVSSQFLTALLLAAPLAATHADVSFHVVGELISKPYIDITIKLLERFGVLVAREGWQRFTVPKGSRYQSPGRIAVEGDASGASYFIGLGALAAHGGRSIRIEGLGSTSIQGDIRFVEAAQAMGADVTLEPNAMTIRRGAWPLRAVTLDCNHIPDAAMTLAVMALSAQGTTRLTNIASWRVKETDRIDAMAQELRKLGATVLSGPDFIAITPPATAQAWRTAPIHTYDDHRIAMGFSLAACNPAGLPIRLLDPECVGKTYPKYFDDFFALAQSRTEDVPVITVDGPTASGKGTVATALAHRLGYHHLDSGAIYRAAAFAALQQGLDLGDEAALERLALGLPLRFVQGVPHWQGLDVSEALREERVGAAASQIAAHPAVRRALNQRQLAFRQAPGLVADGRDMGTVVFPDAKLKVFLTAGASERASRRHKQLISKGISANIDSLRADLEARDARDKHRSVSPLKPADDAQLLDNSNQTVDQTVSAVLGWWAMRSGFEAS